MRIVPVESIDEAIAFAAGVSAGQAADALTEEALLSLRAGTAEAWLAGDPEPLAMAVLRPDAQAEIVARSAEAAAALIEHPPAADIGAFWVTNRSGVDAATATGLREIRSVLRLEGPIASASPPSLPSSLSVRPFAPGDETAMLAVNAAAFSDHPINADWTLPDITDRMARDWWDPDGVFIAWDGKQAAGLCWTKAHAGGLGEIYLIGVAPEWQGRGVGKHLAWRGLRYLSERHGAITGLVYTEGGTGSGLGLYEALGFEVVAEAICFAR